MNSHGQCDGNGISINSKDLFTFLKNSQKISLPDDEVRRRKTLKRFVGSCIIIQTSQECVDKKLKFEYIIGPLSSVNSTEYSIIVDGKEKQLPYSSIIGVFEPRFHKSFS